MNTAEHDRVAETGELIARAESKVSSYLTVLVSGAFLLFVIGLQWIEGTYSKGRRRYSDEPAHYASGLMLRDYLAQGFPEPPLQFARRYYLHHPVIAVGSWPPAFYCLESVWMLIAGTSRPAMLVLAALIFTISACAVFRYTARGHGILTAILCACLFTVLPVNIWSNRVVMLDSLVTLLCFLALITWADFLNSSRVKDALRFSFFAAMALLTKPVALFVFPAAFLAAVVCGKLRLLISKQAVVGIPPFLVLPALAVQSMGLAVLLLAGVGVLRLVASSSREFRKPHWAVALIAPLVLLSILITAPVPAETRYLQPATPFVVLLCLAAVRNLPVRQSAAMLAMCLAFTLMKPAPLLPALDASAGEAADTALNNTRGGAILVSSGSGNEVAMAAELAMREQHRPGHITLCAGKVLASQRWNGEHYKLLYEDVKAVAAALDLMGVDTVIVDGSDRPILNQQHHLLVSRLLREDNRRWKLAGKRGVFETYIRTDIAPKPNLSVIAQRILPAFGR